MNPVLAWALVVALGLLAVLVGGPLVKLVFARVDRRSRAVVPAPPTRPAVAPGPASSAVSAAPAAGPATVAGGGAPDTISPDAADATAPVVQAGTTLRGGAWIGSLERLAIFVSLVAGWPEGIAITLAVKGLARYPELRATTSGTAERFIIGTFTSVLWAAACAGGALWLLALVR